MIRIGLIQFPGANCERETAQAILRAGMQPIEFLWNEPATLLETFDGFIIVGGFSYEDRSRAGIIAALDPIMDHLKVEAHKGKPVLGICNGAQILLEAGMLPGAGQLALTENKRIVANKILGYGFYNAWVNLKPSTNQPTAFSEHDDTAILRMPAAHAQGRFVMSAPLLQQLEKNGLIVFKYCDDNGTVNNDFPSNPNGSMANIAAVCNDTGNVMAIMPHPERCPEGDSIFSCMRRYILKKKAIFSRPIQIPPAAATIGRYRPQEGHQQWLTELQIADNHALTVEKTLQKLGFAVSVKRYQHWEIAAEPEEKNILFRSELLYCDRKETLLPAESLPRAENSCAVLVRAEEDLLSQNLLQQFSSRFSTRKIAIQHGILWQFHSGTEPIHELMEGILSTNIIGNRYAQHYFFFERVS